MKTERERQLEGVLTALVEEYCDYMLINHLGDPEQQHNIIRAREALADEDAGGEPPDGWVACDCVGQFGPNPGCGRCGGDGTVYEGSGGGDGMVPPPHDSLRAALRDSSKKVADGKLADDTPPQQRDALDAALKDKGYCFAELSRGEFAVDDAPVLVPILVRALTNPTVPQHPDDAAVDRFADAMKEKLARARDKGRGGWDDPEQCSDSYLATLLVDHLRKGNPGTFEDVANFAMMLHQRGAIPTTLAEAANAVPSVPEAVRRLPDELRQIAARFKETNYERGLYFAIYALDRALAQSGEGWVPKIDQSALLERVAQITAHRGCCGTEHDPENGKLHGYCVVCGVPWPCEFAAAPEPGPEKDDDTYQ